MGGRGEGKTREQYLEFVPGLWDQVLHSLRKDLGTKKMWGGCLGGLVGRNSKFKDAFFF